MNRRHLSAGCAALTLAAAIACRDRVSGPLAPEVAAPRAAMAPQIALVDLGIPFGATNARATAINERGEVAGGTFGPVPEPGRAFLWSPRAGFTDLGNLGGAGGAGANSVNARGQVVGGSDRPGGTSAPSVFLWSRRDGMRDLLPGDAPPAGPAKINERGEVASTRGPLSVFMANPRPYLWSEHGGVTEIGALPGGNGAVARGLNDHGEVVGEADAPGPGPAHEMHAFLWSSREGMRSLGVVGPVPSGAGAKDVNNRGHVVGVRILGVAPTGPIARGFLWTPRDGLVELHAPGAIRTLAFAINERDQVVGVLVTALGPPQVMKAFLWSRTGGFVVLPELSAGDTQALAINDAGEIAGHSRAPDGRLHAVVWNASGQP